MNKIAESELVLTGEGRVYHLNLLPEDIADNIILVGDQGRVDMVSSVFDEITFRTQNREFKTHTGTFRGKKVSVISTGIGTDNIDIVINELDALVNIDLKTRLIKTHTRSLNLVRVGTSGSLQADIPVGKPVIARMACGFDGLLNFYAGRNSVCDTVVEDLFIKAVEWNDILPKPYFIDSSAELFDKVNNSDIFSGITISAPGFYGPQGRVLRLDIIDDKINEKLPLFSYRGMKITNYEMECSALYGLSALLGHNALTICLIIANRQRSEYCGDYKQLMRDLVYYVLESLLK